MCRISSSIATIAFWSRRASLPDVTARSDERLATLTPRETEVMERVAQGQANKVIAMDLEASQRTVEIHRARVMEKMGVRSVAKLVHAVAAVKS